MRGSDRDGVHMTTEGLRALLPDVPNGAVPTPATDGPDQWMAVECADSGGGLYLDICTARSAAMRKRRVLRHAPIPDFAAMTAERDKTYGELSETVMRLLAIKQAESAATSRAEAAEASAAAMREASLRVKCQRCNGKGLYDPECRFCDDSGHDHECPPRQCCPRCRGTGVPLPVADALASDAGRALLARLADAEAERDALGRILDMVQAVAKGAGADDAGWWTGAAEACVKAFAERDTLAQSLATAIAEGIGLKMEMEEMRGAEGGGVLELATPQRGPHPCPRCGPNAVVMQILRAERDALRAEVAALKGRKAVLCDACHGG